MESHPRPWQTVDLSDLPPYTDVAADVDRLRLGIDPSELHGSLCGYVSGGGRAGREDWLHQLALEADPGDGASGVLAQLLETTRAQLDDDSLGFELLLPDDETPLSERADALLAWCRGFLGGFGLATGSHAALSTDAAEALADLGRIAASELACDDPDNDEESLAEVGEFVRVAALLLHGDCNRRDGSASLH
jgi:uncharacterized protein